MPTTAPRVKVEGARSFGAEVIFEGTTSADRRARAETEAAARGLTMVPPFDHEWIIAGQGTVGLEILDQLPGVAAIVVPIGGGGPGRRASPRRSSRRRPEVRVIGVEPAGAAAMRASLDAGHPVTLPTTASIADGLMPVPPGRPDVRLRQPARRRRRDGRPTTRSSRRCCGRSAGAKVVAEPSGAASIAAVLSGAIDAKERIDGPIVAIVSGGNVGPPMMELAERARN